MMQNIRITGMYMAASDACRGQETCLRFLYGGDQPPVISHRDVCRSYPAPARGLSPRRKEYDISGSPQSREKGLTPFLCIAEPDDRLVGPSPFRCFTWAATGLVVIRPFNAAFRPLSSCPCRERNPDERPLSSCLSTATSSVFLKRKTL